VTDAHALLGHLPALLAGGVRIDRDAAGAAIAPLARALGLDGTACARAILAVADAELVRAVRLVSVERGRDPRRLALLAFGGAGPMHACQVAEQLGIVRVLVPSASGVLSALGAALGERRVDRSRSLLAPAGADGERQLERTLAGLAADAARELPGDGVRLARSVDLRLRGQAFELGVPFADLASACAAFHDEHEARYGFADRDGALEIVTARVALTTAGAALGRPARARREPVRGPASVALDEATCLVPEGWAGAFDADGVLDLRRAP
jgi:N-methylhydantoinase A/oxoprolinase/acetone carboxylase beta subunit